METEKFTSYIIVEFDDNCSEDVKVWLQAKLSETKSKNGAGLRTKLTKNYENKVNFFHLKLNIKDLNSVGLLNRMFSYILVLQKRGESTLFRSQNNN